MSPAFWTPRERETALHKALLEALFRLGEQAAPEGRWRIRALIEDLETRSPGGWIISELRSLKPWLRPRPVDTGRDAADAVAALLGALESCRREEPALEAAVQDLAKLAGPTLDPQAARRLSRKARELQRFASRNKREQQAKVHTQAAHAQHLRESLSRLMARMRQLDTPQRAMLLGDLHQAQGELAQLEGVLERPEAPEALQEDESGADILVMVG